MTTPRPVDHFIARQHQETLMPENVGKQEQKPPLCPLCGAGALGNCGAYGCETPRETCPRQSTR